MKQILLILATMLILFSCKTEIKTENLVGEWEIISYEATKENFPYLTNDLKAVYISNIYKLAKNNNYEILQQKKVTKGIWSINNEKILNMSDLNGDSKNYTIINLEKNKIQLLDTEKFFLTGIIITLQKKN